MHLKIKNCLTFSQASVTPNLQTNLVNNIPVVLKIHMGSICLIFILLCKYIHVVYDDIGRGSDNQNITYPPLASHVWVES